MTLTFSLNVDEGSSIRIEPPIGYTLICSANGALKQLNLPGGKPDCTDDPLTLMLDTVFTKGTYAFGIQADLPAETPPDNRFNIVIRDQEGLVIDAAYGVEGQPLLPLPVVDPLFKWNTSVGGEPSQITMGLTFERDDINVKAMLISLPAGFIHDIQTWRDIQSLNKRFPVATGNWADFSNTELIRIRVDVVQEDTVIPAGTYTFNFPVLVPCCSAEEMPDSNVWYLSLCSDQTCWDKEDSSVMVTFPLAGFQLGELSEQTNLSSEGAPRASREISFFALLMAFPFFC
jgi:hypothetical protein